MFPHWLPFSFFFAVLSLLAQAVEPSTSSKAAAGAPAPSEPPPSFAIAPPPAWVRTFVPDLTTKTESSSEALSYLLTDRQDNLEPRASFVHEVQRVNSEHGLQEGANISVSFDPAYEKLKFHFIRVMRDGRVSERLDRSQIKVIQREREMDAFLYDGSFTAYCQLEDVRVGDVVEYAYTIEGANPVLDGKYFNTFATNWGAPVQQAVIRILYPATRQLHFRSRNAPLETTTTTQGNTTEWLWQGRDIPKHHVDPNTPRHYYSYGSVQVSEFTEWSQVVDWALPLYRVEPPLSAELEEEITRIRAIADPERRILAALHSVQDQIRYLGIEGGVGSHRPTAPSEVFRRRFGDCKDKTLLLATILRAADLNATPALVATGFREEVAQRLPSPAVFNHVIVKVEHGGKSWWLDATRSSQHGPLPEIYTTNFGFALLLKPGTNELTPCESSPDSLPRRNIVETYHIVAPGSDCTLDAVTHFRGHAAEITRAYFRDTTREDIAKNYLQFYSRRYPRIRTARPVEFRELSGENGCEVAEHYAIPDFWQLADDKGFYHLVLHPADVEAEMGTPGATQRTDPLAINYPVQITQEIRAEMFKDWPLKKSDNDVTNPFFHFHHSTSASGPHLVMNYSYQSLADRVSPADLPAYDTALRKIKDSLGYSFTYRNPEQLAAARKKESPMGEGQLNWPLVLLLGVLVIVAVALAIWYYHASRLSPPLPPPPPRQSSSGVEGLGGWLILVGIGQFLRPFVLVKNEFTVFPSVFNLATWQRLTVVGQPAYHPGWMPILLFELIFNAMELVFCILLIFLFLKKRAAWRHCYIILLAASTIGIIIDHTLALQVPAIPSHVDAWTKNLSQHLGGAAVWIPYTLISERVRATFRY